MDDQVQVENQKDVDYSLIHPQRRMLLEITLSIPAVNKFNPDKNLLFLMG